MDTEIVRLHREGKRAESLDRFAEKYQARLLALARRLVGNHEDALDALQEILLQVDRSLPKFKGESSLYTWAFRLATNVCLNYQRKLGRTNSYAPLDEGSSDAILLPVARPDDNPDTSCRARFRQRLVEQALLKLPETQRAVLVLVRLGGHDRGRDRGGAADQRECRQVALAPRPGGAQKDGGKRVRGFRRRGGWRSRF